MPYWLQQSLAFYLTVIAPWLARDPLAGKKFYVNPKSNAAQQAQLWRTPRPADAALMDEIAQQPGSEWFGNWNQNVRGDIDNLISRAAAQDAIASATLYNVPFRDCGGYSAGGAQKDADYRAWIDQVVAGIGPRVIKVTLEPDALPGLDCLSADGRTARIALIKYAAEQLKSKTGAIVYLDAGNSNWQPVTIMAQRLSDAGVSISDGFSLNVSNFRPIGELITYCAELSLLTGGKHCDIATERNGLGAVPDGQIYNPPWAALGANPTALIGLYLPYVDSLSWIKPVGESDGPVNGCKEAGTWCPEYALQLAKNRQGLSLSKLANQPLVPRF